MDLSRCALCDELYPRTTYADDFCDDCMTALAAMSDDQDSNDEGAS